MVRRVAITGAAGQLGRELVQAFTGAGDTILALTRPAFDLTDPASLASVRDWQPDIVVNSAAWTDVDGCARDPERAMRLNGEAAGAVARMAAEAGALVVQVSTNEVFDGTLDRPYREGDEPRPINPYGASKLAGERLVANATPRHLVVRTAWLYGSGRDFPGKIRAIADRMSSERRPLGVVADEVGNPTHVAWLGPAMERLTTLGHAGTVPFGTYHLAGVPVTSRLAWAREILRGHAVEITAMRLDEYRRDSRVPPRAALDVSRATGLGIEPFDWRSRPRSDS